MMRKFRVRFEGEVEIKVSDELLKSCNTDEWRSQMFQYTRDEQFVEHIAYNMVLNGTELQSIDGYTDQPKTSVVFPVLGALATDWEIEATEVK